MFIGVSMQLQAVFKYFLSHTVGRLPLKKKKKKKKNSMQVRPAIMGRNGRGGFGGISPNCV